MAEQGVVAMQGLDAVKVGEAKLSVKVLLERINLPKYAPLRKLLQDRRSLEVVETACALAVLVQPFEMATASP